MWHSLTSALTSATMPGASMPSSLLTSTCFSVPDDAHDCIVTDEILHSVLLMAIKLASDCGQTELPCCMSLHGHFAYRKQNLHEVLCNMPVNRVHS